ncbi:hypothetical protein JMJ35_010416 [Cladonia borealis]|uniref:Uncharacterized protein n=1 Tax=Cladonia borealis TaxID=184061 RepID=A0AA39QQP3_9LECA|nr:hypothetical protein JMJ35_010416 [Cladonia borealis]
MASLAGGFAVTGALYGAGLKQQRETKKEAQARREATPAERIAILEQTRSGLTAKKKVLDTKIAEIEARAIKPDG